MEGSEPSVTTTPHEPPLDYTHASHLISISIPAALPACRDANTHTVDVAAPQDFEPTWRKGGAILTESRGHSRPPRNLATLSPGRGATEKKRIQSGPEYLLHRLSTRHRPRLRYPFQNNSTIQTPQSTVTASNDGLVGCTSPELVVLASPRSIRCLYCYKDFRCLAKTSDVQTFAYDRALRARARPHRLSLIHISEPTRPY